MAKQALISPGSVRGFMSSQSAFALPAGAMSTIQNGRLDSGTVQVRDGGVILHTLTGDGVPRGTFTCLIDGAPYIFQACALAGKVSIFASSDGGATYSNISATSGPYGDTRFTDTGFPVSFEVVNDRAPLGELAHDCLVIQNGVESPRLWAKGNVKSMGIGASNFGMSVITQPEQVGTSSGYFSQGQSLSTTFVSSVVLSTTTLTASTAANFNITHNGGVLGIEEFTTAAAGDFVTATFAAPVVATNSKQLIFGLQLFGFDAGGNITTLPAPEDFKISVSDGVNTDVIWGAGAPSSSFYVDSGTDTTIFKFGYFSFVAAVADLATVNKSAITSFIITLAVTHGVTGIGAGLLGYVDYFGSTGNVQSGANFRVANYSPDNRTVGPSFSFGDILDGLYTGGSPIYHPPARLIDPRVYTAYRITLTPPSLLISATYTPQSFDTINIYAQLLGQSGYDLALQVNYADWNISNANRWTYPGSFSTVITDVSAQDFSYPDPQASCICMPIGSYIRNGNGRLCVAAKSTYYYSTFNNSFLFYQSPVTNEVTNQLDDLSGGSRLFSGEIVQCFIPLGSVAGDTSGSGTPVTGVNTLYLLTDHNLYLVGGYTAAAMGQATPVAPHGTLSPFSVARNETRFYWLDNQRQVRVCQGGATQSLSVEIVDNYTLGIPLARLPWVHGTCLANRFYLAFSAPSTTVNDQVLVWSEIRHMWESLDVPVGYTLETLQTWFDQTNDLLKLIGTDASGSNTRQVQHAKPGTLTDPGQAGVAFSITPPILHADLNHSLSVNSCAVFADSAAGTFNLSVSRLALTLVGPWPNKDADANPAIGTVPITNSGTGAAYTNALDQEGVGIRDAAVEVTLSGVLPGEWNLYSAAIDVTKDTTQTASRA